LLTPARPHPVQYERLGGGSVPRPKGPVLWFHALSIGEGAGSTAAMRSHRSCPPAPLEAGPGQGVLHCTCIFWCQRTLLQLSTFAYTLLALTVVCCGLLPGESAVALPVIFRCLLVRRG
jgi:hypothetical protein